MASQNNVSIWKFAEDVEEGWLGKLKGLLQIMWERGFIDPGIENPEKYYTLDGKIKGERWKRVEACND